MFQWFYKNSGTRLTRKVLTIELVTIELVTFQILVVEK